jgi:hypothetical protein
MAAKVELRIFRSLTMRRRRTRFYDGETRMAANSAAKKSSDFSATVAHFPVRQINAIERCTGAKVNWDLLAAELRNFHSQLDPCSSISYLVAYTPP